MCVEPFPCLCHKRIADDQFAVVVPAERADQFPLMLHKGLCPVLIGIPRFNAQGQRGIQRAFIGADQFQIGFDGGTVETTVVFGSEHVGALAPHQIIEVSVDGTIQFFRIAHFVNVAVLCPDNRQEIGIGKQIIFHNAPVAIPVQIQVAHRFKVVTLFSLCAKVKPGKLLPQQIFGTLGSGPFDF